MTRVVVHQEAKAELRKARRWYELQRPGLGYDLLDEVQSGLSKIEADASTGVRYENTRYRFYRLKRFPYLLYFVALHDHVCVVAIAHARRRPGYWRRRKPA